MGSSRKRARQQTKQIDRTSDAYIAGKLAYPSTKCPFPSFDVLKDFPTGPKRNGLDSRRVEWWAGYYDQRIILRLGRDFDFANPEVMEALKYGRSTKEEIEEEA
jgi:hypothetical protein